MPCHSVRAKSLIESGTRIAFAQSAFSRDKDSIDPCYRLQLSESGWLDLNPSEWSYDSAHTGSRTCQLAIVPFINNLTPAQTRCRLSRNCEFSVDNTHHSASVHTTRRIYAGQELYLLWPCLPNGRFSHCSRPDVSDKHKQVLPDPHWPRTPQA